MCAAFSTVDFSATELTVVSMYGSHDEVLNVEKYQEGRTNLFEHAAKLVIEGGNYAFFGTYGLQEGDGTATISNDSHIVATVTFTIESIR